MRKISIAVLMLVLAFVSSCSDKENLSNVSPSNDHLVVSFKEGDVRMKGGILQFSNSTTHTLFDKKLEVDQAFFSAFIEKFGSSQLISQAKQQPKNETLQYVIENVSANHLLTLNKDGAFIVGDQYVRYGRNGVYWVDLEQSGKIDWKDESALDLSVVRRLKYGRIALPIQMENQNARLQVDLLTNSAPGGGDQYEWQRSSPAGYMKYVTELYSTYEQSYDQNSNLTQIFRLNIRAKLEWKIQANEGWNSWATEYRTIKPNFSCSVDIGTTASATTVGGATFGGPFQQTEWYQNDDWRRQLASYTSYNNVVPGNWKWFITGSGTLKQQVSTQVSPNPEHTTVLSW